MYTREETSLIRQKFWKAFGQYMALHTATDGHKINWVNYKTGIKYISFTMQADHKTACIMITITQPDAGIRALMMDRFKQSKGILQTLLKEEWVWEVNVADEYGKQVSRIRKCISDVSIFRQEDWPTLISFLKPRIMALDEFWSTAQYGFDMFT